MRSAALSSIAIIQNQRQVLLSIVQETPSIKAMNQAVNNQTWAVETGKIFSCL